MTNVYYIGSLLRGNDRQSSVNSVESTPTSIFDFETIFNFFLRPETNHKRQHPSSLACLGLRGCVNLRQRPFPSYTRSIRYPGSPVHFLNFLATALQSLLVIDDFIGRPSSDPSRPSAARLPPRRPSWTETCPKRLSACRILQLSSGK